MTHEFKNIVEKALLTKQKGSKSVLASVVALDGSSYRRPGVRMLILENGDMVGAVSGGCVEKEVRLQAQTVFDTGVSKIMTYDGRYRLGCEGVLYILLELFHPEEGFFEEFFRCLKERTHFEIHSFYEKEQGQPKGLGSFVKIEKNLYSISIPALSYEANPHPIFKQSMAPPFKLVIVGAEHDAVKLCSFGALAGWEVTIIASAKEQKSIENFNGAFALVSTTPETVAFEGIDDQTAIVLMTHNFANDLRYLVALKNTEPAYIGLLGPSKRREDLLNQFIEYCPEIDDAFLERIHGPAGLNIGSETPEEIAISVVAEILAFTRQQKPISLSKKTGKIHNTGL
ncbi:XdhC family protein [Aestuariivivens sediminicola]|uniref:XdhC family protein n=1 Tax=Aestuariivivens sediminicola TaxID=2913560 RepID=UPI001F57F280|nr:XdhC/CoxI family protein [Aestuariivivens sediminicola]